MASIVKDPNGRKRLQYVDGNGKRVTVRLGKMTVADAREVKTKVECILSANISQRGYDNATAQWIASVPDSLADKLGNKGLIPRRKKKVPVPSTTLGDFLAGYLIRRIDVKPATQEVWRTNIRSLKIHFGETCELSAINEGDAEDYKLYLIGRGLASTTIHKRLQFARQFFKDAVKRQFVSTNPFAEVSSKASIPKDRQYFVTLEETEAVLDACDPTWEVIVALCRYGGLRCPSEVLSLRMTDVDWVNERITVTSPKTEHHAGKSTRMIPLFPELKPILLRAFELAPDGSEYVVNSKYRRSALTASGWRNCNLRTQFERIVKLAGLKPWPRLFHSMRASRETELAADYPLHVVTAWLGNTPRIALKHYLQVTDADFEKAAQGGAKSGALIGKAAQNAAQHTHATDRTNPQETTQAPDTSRAYAKSCDPKRDNATKSSGEDRIRTCGPITRSRI
jgi:integrase